MKNLLKFFPVALAAFALASCSNDELLVENVQKEIQDTPENLLVQVGEFDDAATRGGFMTTVRQTNLALVSALYFDEGDQMKVYHDRTSWKPETWTASEFGQYKNKVGIAVFQCEGSTIEPTEDAYGIYPDGAAQFANEDRTAIRYDLSGLKSIDYKTSSKEFNHSEEGKLPGTAYAAKFPLWGVKKAGQAVMTMQHLAGILRIDIYGALPGSKIPTPNTSNKVRYLVVGSTNKVLSGVVSTAADPYNVADNEKVDVANLNQNAPSLKTATSAAANKYNFTANGKLDETTIATKNNIIVMKLSEEPTNGLMAFLPITPGMVGDDVTVYLTDAMSADGDVNLSTLVAGQKWTLTADKIKEENAAQLEGAGKDASDVQPGVFYRISDDTNNQNTTAKTPRELAEAIIEADKAAFRDFTITFTQPIQVKEDDSAPQNFYLDLSGQTKNYGLDDYKDGYELKHNVTVKVTLNNASTATKGNLYIRTKGGKKLTLDIEKGSTALDRIIVNANELKSEVVLKAQTTNAIPNVTNNDNSGNLTIGDPCAEVKTYGKINIDLDENPTTDAITKLIIAKGCQEVNLKNGILTNVEFGKNISNGAQEAVNANVTINATGNSGITAFSNLAGGNGTKMQTASDYGQKNVIVKSVWDGTSNAQALTGNLVFTAAQLANAASATANITIRATEIDLDNKNWTPIVLSYNIDGDYAGHTTKGNEVQTTIKNLNIAATNDLGTGLFKTAKDIKNLVLENVTISNTATVKNVGALLGIANASATISNVTLQGTNAINCMEGQSENIGAIVGTVNTASTELTLADVNVKGTTAITGYAKMGGLVGYVDGSVSGVVLNINPAFKKESNTDYNSNRTYCTVNGVTFTQVANSDSDIKYDPAYAMHGKFIGSANIKTSVYPTIKIYQPAATSFGTSMITTNLTDDAKWGVVTSGKTKYYDIVCKQDLIGVCNIMDPLKLIASNWTVDFICKKSDANTYETSSKKVKVEKEADGDNLFVYINK